MSTRTWASTTLGEILPLQYGKGLPEKERKAGPVPVYGSSGVVGCHNEALTSRHAIVVGRKGNVGQSHLSEVPCWPIDTVYFHEATRDRDLRFFLYLLQHKALRRLDKSTAVPGLSRDDYDVVPVNVPAEAEQRRIVEAVDSYLSRLDAAVASLEAAQVKLKAYRASVLKAAVEGRLVPTEAAQARAEKRNFEPADVLLKRILSERRRRWEQAELAKLKAAGKAPKDDKWKSKYEEPNSPDTKDLPKLPEGWCWASVGALAEVSGGLTKNAARDQRARRLPYLRVANVYANELNLNEIKEIGVSDDELPRVSLRTGDLLVVEGNGSVDQIGRVALWDGSISPMVHQNHLIKARFGHVPLERWALTWLLSPGGRKAIVKVASSTSGLHTLSISKVENRSIP